MRYLRIPETFELFEEVGVASVNDDRAAAVGLLRCVRATDKRSKRRRFRSSPSGSALVGSVGLSPEEESAVSKGRQRCPLVAADLSF